ncbi:cupin domain-containing protein [Streptomyces malaysiensis]|uniref:cupin domain-containing protein n=1 Tax=Streptomyces malaysiensis TaxID=92644 RepID=UPI000C9A3C51|nr:cupin domain-containing protein [Streptomyces sp. DR7-3]
MCATPAKPSLRRHGGYEWLYVLTGAIVLTLGTTTTRVRASEAAEFDTRIPHAMTSADHDAAAEVLALFSTSGEQLHVRQC